MSERPNLSRLLLTKPAGAEIGHTSIGKTKRALAHPLSEKVPVLQWNQSVQSVSPLMPSLFPHHESLNQAPPLPRSHAAEMEPVVQRQISGIFTALQKCHHWIIVLTMPNLNHHLAVFTFQNRFGFLRGDITVFPPAGDSHDQLTQGASACRSVGQTTLTASQATSS